MGILPLLMLVVVLCICFSHRDVWQETKCSGFGWIPPDLPSKGVFREFLLQLCEPSPCTETLQRLWQWFVWHISATQEWEKKTVRSLNSMLTGKGDCPLTIGMHQIIGSYCSLSQPKDFLYYLVSLSDSSSCIVLRPAGSRHALGFFFFSWFHLCSRVVGASDLARGSAASFPSFAPDSQGDRRCVTSAVPATAVKWR